VKIKNVVLIGKYGLTKDKKLIQEIFDFLKKKKLNISCDENVASLLGERAMTKSQLLKNADLAIILGGDGTILKTARSLSKKVVVCYGVNLGTLGFLTESQPEKTIEGIKRILAGKYVNDKRFLLRVTVYRNGKKIRTDLALNDAVINQGSKARLIQLKIESNQRLINRFKADGLIISTPTGSTGHSLSAGGPIVHPKLDAFVLTPICPLSLSNRPVTMPNDRQLNITVETVREYHERVSMTLDGQITFCLEFGDEVKIRKSSRYLYLARMTGENYYKALRAKLSWGE
jgi:NAD+ kinase